MSEPPTPPAAYEHLGGLAGASAVWGSPGSNYAGNGSGAENSAAVGAGLEDPLGSLSLGSTGWVRRPGAALPPGPSLAGPGGQNTPPTALGEEARVCRDLCDALLDVARLRARAAAAKVDITFADTAFDALFRPAGARLTRFQQLTRGTRVRVVHDRQAVLAAFEAQDDVLGLPDDWEASLGCDFIVENYDNGDSTYVLVKPGAFDETSATNAKDGKWWPYSVVVLLP